MERKRLNEKQLYSVKNRVQNIQSKINAFEYPSYLSIIPNVDEYGIYLGDALMQNGSVAQRIKARREEQLDALKIELTYYLSLIEK